MPKNNVSFPIKVLSDNDVEKIYQGSLKILDSLGVEFEDPEMVKLLQEKGCKVDPETGRVQFPADLVEQSLKTCPHEFTIKARNPEYDMIFNGSTVHFGSHPAPMFVHPETGKKNVPTIQEVQDRITVIDACENIDVLLTITPEISGIPREMGVEWVKAETFRKSEKTTSAPAFRDCAKWIIKMAEVVGAEVVGVTSCTPPLFYPKNDTDALLMYAEAGYPVTVGSGIALGGTGPVTLAGSLVQQTAEALAGIVLTQTSHPGTGIFYLTESAPMDMKVGDIAWGSMEVAMLHVAQAQIARMLGVQNFTLFPMSGSLVCDQQAGFEKGMQSLLMALSGISFMSGGGGVHNESSSCIEQLVIDNDMYGMASRFLQGIQVNEDTLAIDVIKSMAVGRETFLKHPHTRDWFAREHFFPHVSNRLPYQTWERTGAKTIIERARERVKEILAKHQPVPLSDEAEKEIQNILKAVEKERLGT